jgi:hypothetical protein
VNAGDVGGQTLAAGLADDVAMDVVRVVLGSGERYAASAASPTTNHDLVAHAQAHGRREPLPGGEARQRSGADLFRGIEIHPRECETWTPHASPRF